MELIEGQVYQGMISVSGAEGPQRRWIVISPFGRTHVHSIDDPLELHCLPLGIAEKGISEGRLRFAAFEPDHPVVELQHEKEIQGIRDTHLGICGRSMHKMLDLLKRAAENRKAYTTFAAGEILALANEALYSENELAEIRAHVDHCLSLCKSAPRGTTMPSVSEPMTV